MGGALRTNIEEFIAVLKAAGRHAVLSRRHQISSTYKEISAPRRLLNYTMANHDMMARSIAPL